MRNTLLVLASAIGAVLSSPAAQALELKVLSAGAFQSTVAALGPEYEKASGNKLIIAADTVGALVKRVEAGEAFDAIVMTPEAIDALAAKGKIAPFSRTNLARVGVGVMVREGAPKPDIATVDAFKKAVLDAKSVSYIDPASGGSSGIYVAKLLQRLGIADQVKPKEKLKQGGYVADLISSGQSELGIHQISEIVPAKGVTLVGPLPADIQNYTVYAAGIRHQISGRGEEADRGAVRPVRAGPVQVQGHGAGRPLISAASAAGCCRRHDSVAIAG
jgi:molybdate transport system substrate-binding protein